VRLRALTSFECASEPSFPFKCTFEPSFPFKCTFEPLTIQGSAFPNPTSLFESAFEHLTIQGSVFPNPTSLLSAPSSPHLFRVRLWALTFFRARLRALDHSFECAFEPSPPLSAPLIPRPSFWVRLQALIFLSLFTWVGHPLQWDPFFVFSHLGRSLITMRPFLCIFPPR
jgi:hypothetical protein